MMEFLEKATEGLLVLKMSEGLLKASLLLRVMAKALDFIVIAAAVRAVPRVGFCAGFAYLLIGDGLFDGRSLGKKIMRLRVISDSSLAQGSFRDSMIRNAPFAAAMLLFNIPLAGWIFPVLILTLEFLLTLGNSEGMRLGDDLAGTKVVEG
jgi:uncharacterized RDD family membrane protein YckC